MKRRLFTSLAAAAAVAASVLISSGSAMAADPTPALSATNSSIAAPGPTPNSGLDVNLRVDETQFKVVATLRGVGKQVYDCVGGAYKFREPMAGLFSTRLLPVGIHEAPVAPTSPFWANFDGSRVVGDTSGATPGFFALDKNPGKDVKWLKVPAASTAGTGGMFSNVAFIQRTDTRGGVAPATCGAPTVSVDYTTYYVFWAKK